MRFAALHKELPLLLSKLETALPGSDGFAVGEKAIRDKTTFADGSLWSCPKQGPVIFCLIVTCGLPMQINFAVRSVNILVQHVQLQPPLPL